MGGEQRNHTMQTTAVVHDAFRAEAMHVSTGTVKRDWRIAKMCLLAELNDRTRND